MKLRVFSFVVALFFLFLESIAYYYGGFVLVFWRVLILGILSYVIYSLFYIVIGIRQILKDVVE